MKKDIGKEVEELLEEKGWKKWIPAVIGLAFVVLVILVVSGQI